ncbi:MAG: thioredoxin domain-containing protein, partial [Chloroflexi bacterium]|nr:thioredoxin domain-containing protein [Chloroflexota bacterium]
MQAARPGQVHVGWRGFSLAQVNHPEPNRWRVWEQPLRDPAWQLADCASSLRAFWAAEAARRQDEALFLQMHRLLLQARHGLGQDLADLDHLTHLAREAGLELQRFRRDMADPTCLERLAGDHEAGRVQGVFGTPTFVFPGSQPVYLKLGRLLSPDEGVR